MKKNSKLLTTILGSTVVVSGFVSLAVTGLNATSIVASNNTDAKDNVVTYWNVTYDKPVGIPNFRYYGSVIVSTRDGVPLGTVTPPKIVCDGYIFDHWIKTNDPEQKPIEPTEPVKSDIALTPVMNPVITELKILSDVEQQYQGFHQSYKYTLSGPAITTDPSNIDWEVKGPNDEDISDIIEFDIQQGTVASGDSLSAYIHPNTKKLIQEPVQIVIKATYNEQTVTFPTIVLPPYYANEVDVPTTPVTKATVGSGYWFIYHDESATLKDQWFYIESNVACSSAGTEANMEITNYDSFIISDTTSTPVTIDGQRQDIKWANITDVYPGCQIKVVDDFFLSDVTHFNGELHGGVDEMGDEKIIHTIGNDFLSECVDFNQNINDVFAVGKLTSLTIGDDFMLNCTSFDNGNTATVTTEPFSLPEAQKYGDMFMAGCSALTSGIVLPDTIRIIGSYFMSDCSLITSFTISEESEDVLWEIGDHCCYNCWSLSNITIDTTTIKYFDEIYTQDEEKKGSFVRELNHDDYQTLPILENLPKTDVSGMNDVVVEQFLIVFENELQWVNPISFPTAVNYYRRLAKAGMDFDWDAFVDDDGNGLIDTESQWGLLNDAIHNGLTSNDIKASISKSQIASGDFSWSNEYNAMVEIDGLIQKVRLVDFDFDKLANGSGNAVTTWEFVDCIYTSKSGSDFEPIHLGSNRGDNYFESDAHKMLNVGGVPGTPSGQSIYDLIKFGSGDLSNALKTVQRTVYNCDSSTGSFTQNAQPVKLFLPTLSNYYTKDDVGYGISMGQFQSHSEYTFEGGQTQYNYYSVRVGDGAIDASNSALIKREYTGATVYENTRYAVASRTVNYGTNVRSTGIPWNMGNDGTDDFLGIAPMFCI